jgi:hypothetical protein
MVSPITCAPEGLSPEVESTQLQACLSPHDAGSAEKVPESDLWKEFLSHLRPHHRDEMVMLKNRIDDYKGNDINPDAKLTLNCFLAFVQKLDLLEKRLDVISRERLGSSNQESGGILELQSEVTEIRRTLESMAPSISRMNQLLKVYADMEVYRLSGGKAMAISNPEGAVNDARAVTLENECTRILNKKAKEDERWYHKKFLKLSLKSWSILIYGALGMFAFISIIYSSSRTIKDSTVKEIHSLSQKTENINASLKEMTSALMQPTISNEVFYQEFEGKSYVRLPDGSWKPVTFRNITPTNTTK